MNKQYLNLTLESDTFRGMKADFDELMQQLLEKLFAGRIADGAISMKLSVSLTETYSETMGKDIAVPLFKHKVTANYTEKLENAGAVSLPNTYLEYDEDLGEFVLKPCGGVQNQVECRRHDLSDGFAIIGVWSQPRVIPGYSTGSAQLRNDAGSAYVELAGDTINIVGGTVNIKAGRVNINE